MLGDRLAEGLALLRVADRLVERPLRHADGAGGDVDATQFDGGHHLEEPLAFLAAEHHVGRDPVIVEGQLDGLNPPVAELVDVGADGDAAAALAGLLLDEQDAHASMAAGRVGIGAHERHHEARLAAVGQPHLGAVDEVLVAVALRLGADRGHVAAGVGLAQRVGAADLARRHPWEQPVLLGIGAERLDQEAPHEVRVQEAADAHPAVGQLLDDLGVGQDVEPEPAVLRGHGDAEQPELLHPLDELDGVLVVGVVAAGVGDDLLVAELSHDRQQLLADLGVLVGRIRRVRHGRLSSCAAPRSATPTLHDREP